MSTDLPSVPTREIRLPLDGPVTLDALRRFVNVATNQGVKPSELLGYPAPPDGADSAGHALTFTYTPRQHRHVGF